MSEAVGGNQVLLGFLSSSLGEGNHFLLENFACNFSFLK